MTRFGKEYGRHPRPRTAVPGTVLAWAGAFITLLVLGGAAVTLGLVFPNAHERARQWETAERCPTGGAAPSCVSTRTLEVSGTTEKRVGRAVHYRVHLRLPHRTDFTDAGTYTIALGEKNPVYAEAAAGDLVEVDFWRGRPQRIEHHGSVQWARDAARGSDRVPLAAGLLLLPLGALCAWLTRLARAWGARPVPRLRDSSGIIVMGLLVVSLTGAGAAPALFDGVARPVAFSLGLDVVTGAALVAFVATRTRHTVPDASWTPHR